VQPFAVVCQKSFVHRLPDQYVPEGECPLLFPLDDKLPLDQFIDTPGQHILLEPFFHPHQQIARKFLSEYAGVSQQLPCPL